MASYHFNVKTVSRGRGESSVANAARRAAEKLYDKRVGLYFDHSSRKKPAYSKIMTPNGIEWMSDRSRLWNAVEATEKRKDSRLAREIEVALPKELSFKQNIQLICEFVEKNFVSKGMVADINVNDDEKNPHAHIILTTREIKAAGFEKKVREWDRKKLLLEWRKSWADLQNEHLKRNGFEVTVDHRSYAEREIDLEPQIRLGPIKRKKQEHDSDREREYERIVRENGERIIQNPDIAIEYLCRQQETFTSKDIDIFVKSHSLDKEQFQRASSAIKKSTKLLRVGANLYTPRNVFEKYNPK